MTLAKAKSYAEHIVEWLRQHCERIQVAGSIRRQRPECSDVDIVAIPRTITSNDLLGNPANSQNLLHEELKKYSRMRGIKWKAGEEKPDGQNWIIPLPKCQLDVFIATPANWGSVLLCRTGPARSNVLLIERAKILGMRWHPMVGLLRGHGVPELWSAETEEFIFTGLQLEYFPPEARDSSAYFARLKHL